MSELKKKLKKLMEEAAPRQNFASERESLDAEYKNMRGDTYEIGLGTDNYSKKKKVSANMGGGTSGRNPKFLALLNNRRSK